MNKLAGILLSIFLLGVLLVVSGAIFIVDETQQVVLTQFGEPMGQPIKKAGLYFKTPFIQTANYLEKRILNWDGDPNQIPTRDKRYIWVDTTARWKIVDPLKFMQSVGTEAGAYARLDGIIDAATRDAISGFNLVETVRNSNRLLETNEKIDLEEGMVQDIALEKITIGREGLTRTILKNAKEKVSDYGIELVDVQIKRITYVEEVLRKVYERMISERKRAAEQFRSIGLGKKAEIEGEMEKELQQIRSGAYRKAQEVKGTADAEATKIFAKAYNKDPDFFAFLKTIETYKDTINEDSILMLTTDSDYYRFLNHASSEPKAPTP